MYKATKKQLFDENKLEVLWVTVYLIIKKTNLKIKEWGFSK